MTQNLFTEGEKNWAYFYKYLNYIRSDEQQKEDITAEKFQQWLEDLGGSKKKDSNFFISDNEFDVNKYFKLIFCLRILHAAARKEALMIEILKERKEEFFDEETFEYFLNQSNLKDYEIPNEVIGYFRWWINIGLRSDSVSTNILGEDFTHNSGVPNWIKVHILSRFIMKRNSALTGPKNFEKNPAIVDDSKYALKHANKFLIKSKEGWGFQKNDFLDPKDIESLLRIEELLLDVRSEKDIDGIIKSATITLGYALTSQNRVLGGVFGYWCNHVLWRCFVCKGETEIAETFEKTSTLLKDYLGKKFDIKMSGVYQEQFSANYGNNIAKQHYERIKIIINMEKIPIYTSNKKINEELKNKDKEFDMKELGGHNQLFASRRNFYKEFVGLEEQTFHKNKEAMGRPIKLFGDVQRRGDWEERIRQIPEQMENITDYLDKADNIVAIPTIRLVIIDLLLLLSRLLVSLNPDEQKPKNGFSWEESHEKLTKIRNQYDELVKPTIEKIKLCIEKNKSRLEAFIGEERLYDFENIINVLDIDKVKTNKDFISKFTILMPYGKRDYVDELTARKMGEKIQNLLKELIDEKKGIKLHFPVRTRE